MIKIGRAMPLIKKMPPTVRSTAPIISHATPPIAP
jgi:hypothetical protein